MKRIGRYVMFDAVMVVYLDMHSSSSTVTWGWNKEGFIRVDIGGAHEKWAGVVKGAMHELIEAAFVLRRCHFAPQNTLSVEFHACDQIVMMCRHHEFSEIIAHSADALTYILPALEKAWRKATKGKVFV